VAGGPVERAATGYEGEFGSVRGCPDPVTGQVVLGVLLEFFDDEGSG
jgi:hypothetical protein